MDDLKLYGSNQNETDSLVRTVEIVTKDTGMKFGIDKCGVLTMKKGREVKQDGIELENGEENGQVGEGRYKYLGIMEKRDIYQEEINAKHVFQMINTWLVTTIQYSAGIIECMRKEAKEMDWKTKKTVTMYS